MSVDLTASRRATTQTAVTIGRKLPICVCQRERTALYGGVKRFNANEYNMVSKSRYAAKPTQLRIEHAYN